MKANNGKIVYQIMLANEDSDDTILASFYTFAKAELFMNQHEYKDDIYIRTVVL